MSGGGFYRGTSQDQDARFSNKDKKLLNSMKWPEEFSKKVDLKKVNFEVIKGWITKRITELLGFEDDVVINLVVNQVETPDEKSLDPRKIQLTLAVFLQKNASKFTKELWDLLLEAQDTPEGIPQVLVENKKEEMLSKKEALKKEAEKLENLKRFLQPGETSKEAPSNLNKLAKIMKDKRTEDVSNPNVSEKQVETNVKQPAESSRRKDDKNERSEKVNKPPKRREEANKTKRKKRSSSKSSSSSESRERQKAKDRKQKQKKYRSRSRSKSRSKSKERERKNRHNEKSRKEKQTKSREEESRYSKKPAPSKSKKEESSGSDSDSSDSESASSGISSSDSE